MKLAGWGGAGHGSRRGGSLRHLPCLLLCVGCLDRREGPSDTAWEGWEEGRLEGRARVRAATWNVLELGEPGAFDYEATARVLRRLDADVVGLNEIVPDDASALDQLAEDLGYDVVIRLPVQPFGDTGNALLARLPLIDSATPDAGDLSSDSDAEDMTRRPIVARFQLPGSAETLGVVVQHWKSGFDDADVFRRAVDGWRTAQAASGLDDAYVLAMGDVNAEPDEVVVPSVFTQAPGGLPGDFSLGADVEALLDGEGLVSQPYAAMADVGLRPTDAAQRDGSLATRPESGRRIDMVFSNDAVRGAGLQAEVYDSRDDTPEQPGLADGEPRPELTDVNRASDHLPVLVEFRVTPAE